MKRLSWIVGAVSLLAFGCGEHAPEPKPPASPPPAQIGQAAQAAPSPERPVYVAPEEKPLPPRKVVETLRRERSEAERLVERFLRACDAGRWTEATALAERNEHINEKNLPALWKDAVRRRAGAMVSLAFGAPAASERDGAHGTAILEPGRAALPVRFTGKTGTVALEVVLGFRDGLWRVCDVAIVL